MFLVIGSMGIRRHETIEEAYEDAFERLMNGRVVIIVHVTTAGSVIVAELNCYEAREPS